MNRFGYLLVLVLACVAAGCGSDSETAGTTEGPAPSTPAVESVRIASFNVNWANRNLPLVVAALREADADIVLLQETTPESEAFVLRQLGAQYPHRTIHGHEGRYWAERFAILSRYPLRGIRFVPPEHGLFGCVIARIALGDRQVQIADVHLQPFNLSGQGGVWAFLGRTTDVEGIHSREIDSFLAALEPGLPTIICGDFNSLSGFAAPTRLREQGFTDSFAAVHADADQHATWHWPLGRTEARLRIDYVFHDASFETRSSRRLCETGSDHCLVVSELRLRAATN